MATAEIGVIGGSGFYSFFAGGQSATVDVEVDTPYGPPSGPITVGEVAGRSVAFLPRHGRDHQFPPHLVNYRANLWALRSLGVTQVLGPCAVGSLLAELGPGTLVVPDQVVDRTWGREHTVYGAGQVHHVSFAEPYCPRGRAVAGQVAADDGWPFERAGTLVVINGPRFSSRAESQWHAAAGWSVVGMTGMPEASLARELELCYTSLALVTDHDAGVEGQAGVTHDEVLKVFADNIERLKSLLQNVIRQLPVGGECACSSAG